MLLAAVETVLWYLGSPVQGSLRGTMHWGQYKAPTYRDLLTVEEKGNLTVTGGVMSHHHARLWNVKVG